MLDETEEGDEVELFVEVVSQDVSVNVAVVDAARSGQVDGVGVGVEAGGLHFGAKRSEVRAGAAADVERGLNFSVANKLRRVVGGIPRAQQLS